MIDYSEKEGKLYHIQAGKGDVGRYVILPGDPKRCKHIARYFDFVAGSELDGTRTDKAEVIRWALSHIGEPPESAVMVGDRKHDMIGAVKTGTYPLGALYGYGSREELTEAGAKHLAQTPSEIGEYILTDL